MKHLAITSEFQARQLGSQKGNFFKKLFLLSASGGWMHLEFYCLFRCVDVTRIGVPSFQLPKAAHEAKVQFKGAPTESFNILRSRNEWGQLNKILFA